MGMVICEKHGLTGIAIGILNEICDKIVNDEPISQNILRTVVIEYFVEDELLISHRYLITDNFKRAYKLAAHYKIKSDEEDERIFKPIDPFIGAICGKCFEEYLLKYNLQIPE
jgi:hypothetical protein